MHICLFGCVILYQSGNVAHVNTCCCVVH